MRRHSITTVLGSLLVALSVLVQSPAARAYEPCDGQADNRCVVASASLVGDVTTEQIIEFDALTAIVPDVTAADAAPIVNLGAPCITDGQGNCAASPARD